MISKERDEPILKHRIQIFQSEYGALFIHSFTRLTVTGHLC